MKHVRLGDLLTQAQLDAILKIGNDPARVTKEVIEPALAEINRKSGQENDARYLGYAVCFVLSEVGAWDDPGGPAAVARRLAGLN